MDHRAAKRLAVLSAHLASDGHGTEHAVHPQGCAATQRINFARPAHPGTLYSRVVLSEELLGRDQQALAHAAWTIRQLNLAQAPRQPPTAPSTLPAAHPAGGAHKGACTGGSTGGPRHSAAGAAPAFARPAHDSAPAGAAPVSAAPPPPPRRVVPLPKRLRSSSRVGWLPKVDMVETEEGYELDLAVAGVRPEELRVELRGRELLVSGVRPRATRAPLVRIIGGTAGVTGSLRPAGLVPEGGALAWARELARGPFVAAFTLPRDADTARIAAEVADGMLRVRLLKTTY